MTTAASVLDQRLSQVLGDWIEVLVTTYLTTNNSVISTNLKSYDKGRDNFFNGWWVYITNKGSAGVDREVSAYTSSTGTLTIRGNALTATDTEYATIRLYRYSYTAKQRVLNDAIRELYPILFREIEDRSLVTNNHLFNGHFDDWTLTTVPDFWGADHLTSSTSATAGNLIRGGTKSVMITASAAGGYLYQASSSATTQRLLDLMNQTVTFRAWANPEIANDASLVITTIKADGTTQTLTSTTTCPAQRWTLLELEDQKINDDIYYIDVRLVVATNGKYVYFDNARISGKSVSEYMLPLSLQSGEVKQVYVQSSGYSDDPCDDVIPETWDRVYGINTIDNTYKYLYLRDAYARNRQLRLIGIAPLETISAFTDTVSIDAERVDLLVNYAAYKLFLNEAGTPSSSDTGRFRQRANDYLQEFYRLKAQLGRMTPAGTQVFS